MPTRDHSSPKGLSGFAYGGPKASAALEPAWLSGPLKPTALRNAQRSAPFPLGSTQTQFRSAQGELEIPDDWQDLNEGDRPVWYPNSDRNRALSPHSRSRYSDFGDVSPGPSRQRRDGSNALPMPLPIASPVALQSSLEGANGRTSLATRSGRHPHASSARWPRASSAPHTRHIAEAVTSDAEVRRAQRAVAMERARDAKLAEAEARAAAAMEDLKRVYADLNQLRASSSALPS